MPRLEPLDTPPSPLPPPLDDDLPEGEENRGATENNNLCTEVLQNSTKKNEDMVSNSDYHRGMDLEALLEQRTFTRSEYEYLSGLLWSRTIGSSSLKTEDRNIRKMHVSEQENESRNSRLPLDLSIPTYNVAGQFASPAEIAKAYMVSKSSKAPPLHLRLHDLSSMPIKSSEASMIKKAKPPMIPPLQSSRLHTYNTSDHLESNYTTPNRSAIYKMSSSPYFMSGVSSKELFSTVSSSYQTPNSVHTYGRQVLKRKSIAAGDEIVSVGPIRRINRRFNRASPLLETRPGYPRYLGDHGSQLDKGSEESTQIQKRRCLNKVGDGILSISDDRAHANIFGQAPVQSSEMAAKILKQLDTLVPAQEPMKESLISRQKEVAQNNHLEPSSSEVKKCSLPNGINSTAKSTPTAVTENIVDATSNKSDNEKPPTSLRNHTPNNLVLSSEIDRKKMSIPSNGCFTFPVSAVIDAHSQAPPTPTMASPPILPVEKQQPSAVFNALNTCKESHPRISQPVPEEGSIANKFYNEVNADFKPLPSKNSGQGASFTSNPVFKVLSLKPTFLSNGPGHMSNSIVSAIQPSDGSTNAASVHFAGYTTSTASKSTQNSSTGGSSTLSNSGIGSLAATNMLASTACQSVAAPPLTSSGSGSPSAPFGLSPLSGTASSSSAEDNSKPVSSTTPYLSKKLVNTSSSAALVKSSSTTPFSSTQQFGIASSVAAAEDKSKAVGSSTLFGLLPEFGTRSSSTAQDISMTASPVSTVLFGNPNGHSGNSNSLITQNSVNRLSFMSSEKSNNGSLQSSADSQVGSTHTGSNPFNPSSVFPWAAGSGPSVVMTGPPSSARNSCFGSSPASSASLVFGSKLNAPVPPSIGLANTGPSTSLFSPTPSAVFSFTSSTPSILNPSPTTPFGGGGPSLQVDGGNMAANRNGPPFPTALSIGLPSSMPSTPTFSMPATQFTSNTTSRPGVFGFDHQSQASSGGFSVGLGGGSTDKSGRKFIRVKKRK